MKDPEVLDNTLIDAKVEFNLTKDDLTDMVLDERQELLEDELSVASKERKKLETKLDELCKKQHEAVLKLGKQKLSKRAKAAEKFTGEKAVYTINSHQIQRATDDIEVKFVTYEKDAYRNNNRRRKVERSEWIRGCELQNSVVARCHNKVDHNGEDYKAGKETFADNASWSASVNLSTDEVAAMPIVKDIVKVDTQHKELVRETKLLETELSNLETSGKRARAKMVRALLSASKQGRQLLSKMPKMNHKLLSA